MLGCLTKANNLIKAIEKKQKEKDLKEKKAYVDYGFDLIRKEDNSVATTLSNFEDIVENEPYFENLRYNTLLDCVTVKEDGKDRLWTDGDDSLAYGYISRVYGIYNPAMCDTAILNIALRKKYNPLKFMVESLTWDKEKRIDRFLIDILKCEDTPYVKEVSRLIFAGGIHRIIESGCKFDSVPVFIGKQGEGKSTIVRWLAMEEEYFSEVFSIEGKDGLEAIRGKWICELGELIAVTKSKEVEAVKSYLTRQSDYYRRPYEKRAQDYKRSCIFIGTTNRQQFLTDKTGNRRFLPVTVNCTGDEIYDNEKFIKHYIKQCWAEAYYYYKLGQLSPTPERTLINEIKANQDSATEIDYRIDLIREYLEGKTRVCVLSIWENALKEKFSHPTKKDSTEIGLIMQQMDGWERSKGTIYIENYGAHRGWIYT
ncbi:MAG: hypothetical protein IKT78_05800, partial [Ruminiclostridium sp.]|nr:hypothetical protein [Ruminiclostridium sp.]